MSKTIYFVRHGQTALNAGMVHQYADTPLSPKGAAQANILAEHFASIPIDAIVSSPLARAIDTAYPIAHKKGLSVETQDFFAELRRPRTLWGTHWLLPRSLWIMGLLYLHAGKKEWHHSDEENLEEFHTRVRKGLEYLADRKEERILVVTHRGFIAAVSELIKHDGTETVGQYRRALWKNITIGNACYLTTTWDASGAYGNTLDGTWHITGPTTCPAGGKYSIGLG